MAADSQALRVLAGVHPRTADMAFEAGRHASQCDKHLQRATFGITYLKTLMRDGAQQRDTDGGRLLDIEAHLCVLENKARIYSLICATVETIEDALGFAKRELDLLGKSSTHVMRALRAQMAGPVYEACHTVAKQLVREYTARSDRYSDMREELKYFEYNDALLARAR